MIWWNRIAFNQISSMSRPYKLLDASFWSTRFFTSNEFFSTQPQCCLTFSWIEPQILLRCYHGVLRNTYNYRYIEKHFVFSMFLWSIYEICFFFEPLFHSHYRFEIRNIVKKETLAQVFSREFCEISKNTFFIDHLRWLLLSLKAQSCKLEKC